MPNALKERLVNNIVTSFYDFMASTHSCIARMRKRYLIAFFQPDITIPASKIEISDSTMSASFL
ncbi:MAG: hypothetical protein BGO44_03915 [Legionella sp. 39-23]|nr:MAG: hypothetical protein BGO44_03915 [Legionella sp. 39-23]